MATRVLGGKQKIELGICLPRRKRRILSLSFFATMLREGIQSSASIALPTVSGGGGWGMWWACVGYKARKGRNAVSWHWGWWRSGEWGVGGSRTSGVERGICLGL